MKIGIYKFVFGLILSLSGIGSVYAIQSGNYLMTQTKLKFLRISIPKLDSNEIEMLLTELRSYEGKVSEADFNFENRELTLWYTDALEMDDILEVLSKYTLDFSKLAGTEMQ